MAIGQSKQRLDAEAKVTGRPGIPTIWACRVCGTPPMCTAPSPTAWSFPSMPRKRWPLPALEAVFTADDVPGFLFPTAGHPYSMDPSHGDVADRLLLTKHVRYYGDEVAVVVARDGPHRPQGRPSGQSRI